MNAVLKELRQMNFIRGGQEGVEEEGWYWSFSHSAAETKEAYRETPARAPGNPESQALFSL